MYNPKIVKLERRHRLLSMDTSEPARLKDEYDDDDKEYDDDKDVMKTCKARMQSQFYVFAFIASNDSHVCLPCILDLL